MKSFISDLRYGFRVLIRDKFFTFITIFTISISVGANVAIFALTDALLLKPYLYKEADRIAVLTQTKNGAPEDGVSVMNFLDIQEQAQTFEQMAIIEPFGLDYSGHNEPESIPTGLVSQNFFSILGVQPLLGRTFLSEEFQPGKNMVVVMSYGLWQRKFALDRSIVGRQLILDEKPFTLIGIMPAGFQFPHEQDFWVPKVTTEEDRKHRGAAYLTAIGRLKSGSDFNQADAEMQWIAKQLTRAFPQVNQGLGIRIQPLREALVGSVRLTLFIMLAAVSSVLLIACANVAGLMLAHTAARKQEFSVRRALGAKGSTLLKQFIAQNLLLALFGGFGGMWFAAWTKDSLVALLPMQIPGLDQIQIGWKILGFTFSLSVIIAFTLGLVSFQFISRQTEGSPNSVRTISNPQKRFRYWLVIVQLALVVVLLVSTGLLTRSYQRLLAVDLGFEEQNVLALQLFAYGSKYETSEQKLQFFEQVSENLSSLPGVAKVGAASFVPFTRAQIRVQTTFLKQDAPPPPPGQEPGTNVTIAGGQYFEAMGIKLVAGRTFSETDRKNSPPIALINDVLARQYWPGENPIGREIILRFGKPVVRKIVGVVAAVRQSGLTGEKIPEVFLPLNQYPFGSMTLIVKTEIEPQKLIAAAKNSVWTVDKQMPIYSIGPLTAMIYDSLKERRFQLLLLSFFSGFGLCLSILGVYAVIRLLITQRSREFGVRIALGAQKKDILKLVMKDDLVLTMSGLMIGIIASLAFTRLLASFLFMVGRIDPLTLVTVCLLLFAASLLAGYFPAKRAAKTDPVEILRYE